MIRTPQKYNSGNEINENERGRAYSMHWGGGRQEIDIRGFGRKKNNGKLLLEVLRIVRKTIPKLILNKYDAMA
jgi:hypothetical protein